ncbi:MAG TPA: bifunctional alpha,alpha-trehalose-phosphate synthase (UDP-forming)/trehalose-phosphatase [Planctomycetota bacterium]|nr:bifunctional alpha,alpha-trehalose-phosphate synthase (UDP-forming)/trehalose-phosphatase [Planctomycetota bacterium]
MTHTIPPLSQGVIAPSAAGQGVGAESSNGNPGIIVVSNRLPVRVTATRAKVSTTPSAGGLASALLGVQGIRAWVGWPGAPVSDTLRARVAATLARDGLRPVYLSAEEERHHYGGMCNGVLWPLLHYFPDKIEFDAAAWDSYVAVNRRFAEQVIEISKPGDTVWVHDFQLMLLPALLREHGPDLVIGFFLHVPFPSSELWRLLPQREVLLRGLLGADYIAFHTADYLSHFRNACLRVLGIDFAPDAVKIGDRRIGLGVHPLGPDVERFRAALASPEQARYEAEFAARWRHRRLVLGVERLDYSKGVMLKLRAFERLLQQEPERIEDTVMLQVLVPSREDNEGYRQLLREIEREVGRINGRYGRPGLMPLEYVHRNLDEVELSALYCHADLCMVAPVRDGMNLVAQEFVLCQGLTMDRADRTCGVLVLSEFAGSAFSLARAIMVNPWDIDALTASIPTGLGLPLAERHDRIGEMLERVLDLDSSRWAGRFLGRLRSAAARNDRAHSAPLDGRLRDEVAGRFRRASRRQLFLDYDGTLQDLARRPELAAPTPPVLDLLQRLATTSGTEVHVVSGRRRGTLDAWLGHLPIHLAAEHGYFRRAPGGEWQRQANIDVSWLPRVTELLKQVAEEVPGSFLERKSSGLCWHYRLADPEYGAWRAGELLQTLDQLFSQEAAEHLHGNMVVEVRAKGADKGAYVASMLAASPPADFVLCAGDDRTDQDMYARMPRDAIVVNVGPALVNGPYVVASPAELRRLLNALTNPA